jgi:hypothetical protein
VNPTTRLLAVRDIVTNSMTAKGISSGNDLSKKFAQDMQINLGSFAALLDVIERGINGRFQLARQFRWAALGGDPATGTPFAAYFLTRSINELIVCLDGVLADSSYSV